MRDKLKNKSANKVSSVPFDKTPNNKKESNSKVKNERKIANHIDSNFSDSSSHFPPVLVASSDIWNAPPPQENNKNNMIHNPYMGIQENVIMEENESDVDLPPSVNKQSKKKLDNSSKNRKSHHQFETDEKVLS